MTIYPIDKKLFIVVLFLFLAVGCTKGVKTDKNLNGKSIEFIKDKFGSPNYDKEFVLSKSLYEYQYGLLVYYPEPDGKNIKIKELNWNKGSNNIVVWFHIIEDKWVSFDNITWNPDKVKF